MTDQEKMLLMVQEFDAPVFSIPTSFAVQSFVDSLNADPAFCAIVECQR